MGVRPNGSSYKQRSVDLYQHKCLYIGSRFSKNWHTHIPIDVLFLSCETLIRYCFGITNGCCFLSLLFLMYEGLMIPFGCISILYNAVVYSTRIGHQQLLMPNGMSVWFENPIRHNMMGAIVIKISACHTSIHTRVICNTSFRWHQHTLLVI